MDNCPVNAEPQQTVKITQCEHYSKVNLRTISTIVTNVRRRTGLAHCNSSKLGQTIQEGDFLLVQHKTKEG